MPVPRCALRLRVPRLTRMSSSTPAGGLTFSMAAPPPKAHHHQPIPAHTFPRGFLLGGTYAGVKKVKGTPDLALAVSASPRPAAAAGVFTRNAVAAAPVRVSAQVLETTGARVRAVVVNSGCANAVTGKRGLDDAWSMVRAADGVVRALDPGATSGVEQSLVMSTGVIGQPLPIERILNGIASFSAPQSQSQSEVETAPLGDTFAHWERAARAFMTTDTFPKLRARTFRAGGREYRLGGMSKGAGMIHPDMGPMKTTHTKKELHATLLALILTDAPVAPGALQRALEHSVARSFNSISVDGDMSTNDTVLVLANGAGVGADVEEIDETRDPEAFAQFRDALTDFAAELAQLVVRDGEGATKFVTVTVDGAATYEDAHSVASRISTSALVKTALYGEDANWGRILAATGSLHGSSLSTALDPTRISVSFVPTDGSAPLPLLVAGEPCGVDETRAKQILRAEDLELRVELGLGKESARYWTCDFSYEYVRINGDYRS